MTYKIGHHLATDLAEEHGTPLYVYNLEVVRRQAKRLQSALPIPNKKILYAIKINYNPQVVKAIKECGYGIDAVSLEEIEYALKLGFKPEDILYTGNNITDFEMRRATELGVMLNIGATSRLEKFGKEFPGSRVCVRINPNIEADTHEHWVTAGPLSKFGTSYAQVEEILEIAQRYDLKIVGVHEHIGTSVMKVWQLLKAMEVLIEVAPQFPDLEFLNFGGGIGIAYKPDDIEIDIEDFGAKAAEMFNNFCESYGKDITFMMEPGRYIVADSGTLLAEVNTLKVSPDGRTFAGLNTGYHHLIRPMTYGSYHPIKNASQPGREEKKYDVAGNICESGDLYARDRMISEIDEYDILAIEKTGASGFCMANHYHLRPLPPEIIVDGENVTVSRPRESLEDVIKLYQL